MDIHRSRFIPYPPSAINALAFSHPHPHPDDEDEDPISLRLAIGRANGNIEIWNPANGTWLQERTFYGGKDRSVEGLAWTQEPDEQNPGGKTLPGRLRLFSIGYSNSVTEWDLGTGLPLRHSDGNHSEVWCFAVQPKAKTSLTAPGEVGAEDQQKLVAGCADGSLVLLSTAEDELIFEKYVSRSSTKKARVLSVTYKDRNVILAGFADSTIRVLDTRNGSVLRTISLGSGPLGGPKETLVWKVKCLSNGDFVSGDSTGDIRIYDGKNFSQTQRISGHEADVLDLAVSRDGTMIFSCGMDRRTCFYTCNKKTGAPQANRGEKWRKVSHKRYHDHDVKAMATYEGNTLSVVVSGGIDTQPVVIPLRTFGKELSRALPALPHTPPLVSAPEARLVVGWWNCEVRIWRVKSQEDGTEKPKVVARLALQGDENITSVSITKDGRLLTIATGREVKLFQLVQPSPGAGSGLRIRKLDNVSASGARLVRFTADGKWLARVTVASEVHIARIISPEDEEDRPRVLPQLLPLRRLRRDYAPQNALNGPSGQYERAITHAEFSSDGALFAVADIAGYIDTWVTEGHEDSTALEIDIDSDSSASVDDDDSDYEDEDEEKVRKERITILGQRWIRNPTAHLLPCLESMPVLLSFQPGPNSSRPEPNGNPAVHATRHNPHPHSHDLPEVEHQLLVVSARHQLYHFEVLAGRLSEWSRRNPLSSYPPQFRLLKDAAKGCTWDVVDKRNRVWLYGENWVFMFDLERDFPIQGSTEVANMSNGDEGKQMAVSKKRKRGKGKDLSRKKNSGAGDAVSEQNIPVTKLRTFAGGKSDEAPTHAWTDLNDAYAAPDSDSDLEDEHQALASLRRSTEQDGVSSFGSVTNGELLTKGPTSDQEDTEGSSDVRKRRQEPWWHTFKYRPILGMVPVGGHDQPLEVVLVERPPWDLDLPPRFVGSHE
ncbi:small nucleolar ribonucleoprotein-like protein complex subunit [Massariosphaeria phaeospora]|uniref:Small nucleolar ribonucleoprotein-like protein complex subunit n=1 Tax=Massariosphaeria phaeospora TaxID=100035 RepID=A0A7C8MMF0_9PLEO|nr:small nucleolar ribonucleoprotein-like protein complex subunit [Massariosphaeria phaeospora]